MTVTCPHCRLTPGRAIRQVGEFFHSEPCPHCGGTGFVSAKSVMPWLQMAADRPRDEVGG